MSQQEKLALKAAKEQSGKTQKSSEPTKTGDTASKNPIKDAKKENTLLRPSTPPGQTGSKFHDDDGNSPASQACTSGTVTPTSEGVKRSDRHKFHAPPGAHFAP